MYGLKTRIHTLAMSIRNRYEINEKRGIAPKKRIEDNKLTKKGLLKRGHSETRCRRRRNPSKTTFFL